jgi:hypothetical protein
VTYYRQCKLERFEFPAATQQVAWIPEQFAVAGKYVMIREENGWKVMEVSSHRQSEDYVLAHERDHVGHRSRTDI